MFLYFYGLIIYATNYHSFPESSSLDCNKQVIIIAAIIITGK